LTLIGAEARLKVLMLASLNGDAKAYRQLLDALRVGLGGYFRLRLGEHAADEEDLVQDTLTAIHQRRGAYDPSLPVSVWVYAIARYKLIDHYRRQRIRRTVPLEAAGPLFAGDETDGASPRLALDRLLATLPPSTRRMILATRIEGRSHGEAGAGEGISETAAKVRTHRAMKGLADRFALKPDAKSSKGGGRADG